MSTKTEKVEAQRRVFCAETHINDNRHMIGPAELEYLLDCEKELAQLKEKQKEKHETL